MAIVVVLVLSIPFAVSGRWGLLGVGFNNDLGLHLAWAEWLRSGFGPAPDAGYPLGPHGARGRDRRGAGDRPRPGLRRRDLRDRRPHRADRAGGAAASWARCGASSPRPWSRSPTSPPPTSPRPPSRRPPRRSSSSPSPSGLPRPGAAAGGHLGAAPLRPALARPRRRHLLRLQLRRARLADRDRRALEPDRAGGAAGAGAALAAALPAAADDAGRRSPSLAGLAVLTTWSARSASAHGFNKVAGSNTYGPVSPVEALGIWLAPNYRLDAAGRRAPDRPGRGDRRCWRCWSASIWWVRRRDLAVPIALGACAAPLPRLAPLQRRLLAGQGADDRRAAGDAGRGPAAADRAAGPRGPARRPRSRPGRAGRLGWGGWRRLHRRRRLLELPGPARRARSARPATAPSCERSCRSSTASRSSTPARTATPPTSCSAPTPTCRWSSSPTRRSRRTRKSRSTPATPTARSTSTPSPRRRSTASPT